MTTEATTKASHPKMASLRWVALQRAARAAMLFLACIGFLSVGWMRPAQIPNAQAPFQWGWQASAGAVCRHRGVAIRTPKTPCVEDNRRVSTSVLIVDDHPSFRASARRMLEAGGYAVIAEAADGEEALAVAGRLAPDLVLLDVQLPGIDGFEVAERLAVADDAPAIVLTSSRERSDFGAAIAESAARGFVPKGELSGATHRGAGRDERPSPGPDRARRCWPSLLGVGAARR